MAYAMTAGILLGLIFLALFPIRRRVVEFLDESGRRITEARIAKEAGANFVRLAEEWTRDPLYCKQAERKVRGSRGH